MYGGKTYATTSYGGKLNDGLKIIIINSGVYVYTGSAIAIKTLRKIIIQKGEYNYTGKSINLIIGRLIAIANGSYTYTGNVIILIASKIISISSGIYNTHFDNLKIRIIVVIKSPGIIYNKVKIGINKVKNRINIIK